MVSWRKDLTVLTMKTTKINKHPKCLDKDAYHDN